MRAAIYARVSTTDQDARMQIRSCTTTLASVGGQRLRLPGLHILGKGGRRGLPPEGYFHNMQKYVRSGSRYMNSFQ